MIKPIFNYSLKKRTIIYFLIGSFSAFFDFLIFLTLSNYIDPFKANLTGYISGSLCSFLLNRKITFKSLNSKLSFIRYVIVIFIGLISSQIIMYIGIKSIYIFRSIFIIKLISIFLCALIQYIGNTFFSNIKK